MLSLRYLTVVERDLAGAPARYAAIGLPVVWLVGGVLFPVVVPSAGAPAEGLADLREHPIVGVVHFVLLGLVAPALCLIAAAPTVLRLKSAGTRFSVASAGIGACGVSLVQLGFGAVLTCTRPGVYGDQAIAAAFHDLDGVKAALVAVALVGIMSDQWSSTVQAEMSTRADRRDGGGVDALRRRNTR